jgi:hypothetical protein
MKSGLVTAIVAAVSIIQSDHAPAQVRKIPRSEARRVVDLIQPNERSLVIVDTSDPPLTVGPPAETSLLQWASEIADAILLIEVVDKQSNVTVDERWIDSLVTALVLDVFKLPSHLSLSSGLSVSFGEWGGAMVINGTEVNAVVPNVRQIDIGRRYLVFVGVNGSKLLLSPTLTYELTDDGLLSQLGTRRNRPVGIDNIERRSVDEVAARIREIIDRIR